MSQVNISQAARLAGKSRTTIHRKLKNGELSMRDGKIDSSELLRVFGTLTTQDGTVPPSVQRVTSEQIAVQKSEHAEVLQAKLDAANQLLAMKDVIIEEKDKRLALLEHNPQRKSENSPPREYDSHDTDNIKHSINTHTPEREKLKEERKTEGRVIKLARFLFDT